MNVLVTGGAGFIGSHVVRTLLEQDAAVTVLDSFVTSTRLGIDTRVQVIEGDIRDRDIVQQAMEGKTHVVHLAALVSVPMSVADPELTHAVNVEGTKNVLDAAHAAGVSRLVYASSAAVYGNEPSVPKREDSPLHPESPYASSKAEDERLAAVSGISTMGLRFFNVYGPGQTGSHPYASVIPRWMEALRDGRQITVYGDGSQTRDFIHVADVAAAVVLSLASSSNGVANIASGTERSLQEVLGLLSAHIGRPLDVEYLPPRPGDIVRSYADISLAHTELGFSPRIDFARGISDLTTTYGIS